jgi:hypothetical protein
VNALAKRKAAKRTVVSSIDLRLRRGMLCVRTKKSLYEGIAAVESCNDDFGARVVWMMPGEMSSGTGGFGAGIAIDCIAPDENLMTRESITSETLLEVSNNPLCTNGQYQC